MTLRHTRRREGMVVIAVAVSLVAILGVLALSLDCGMEMDKRRQLQAAADAAAYSGGSELFKALWSTQGLDPNGTIAAHVKKVAEANGFKDGANGVTVVVRIPPTSGSFVGQAGHCEVIITANQKRYFSRVFGPTADIPVTARAVARGKRATVKNGIIVLNPTKDAALTSGGGGAATVTGSASVIVNSSAAGAMNANGGGSLSASSFEVTGVPGYTTSGGGSFVGTINSGVAPTPDPLRFVPPPDPTTLTVRSTKKLNHSNASTLTLQPGVYQGGISITGKGNVVLQPGIYYMQGGGFSMTGQGSLTGNGVMIYNDPTSNSDNINLAGQGAITLTPPTSGPYQGFVLFQRRSGLPQPDINVTGNGTAPMYITGTFYGASALLKVTGNGTQDTIGAQYISDTLTIGGNGSFNVSWDPNVVPGIRQAWLVE